MATGITGRLVRRTTKEPLQDVTIVAVNASTGAESSTSTTTDTKGFFELSGLTSAVYFAKALVSGDDWDLQPNIAEIYTDEIHIASNGSLTIDGAVSAAKDIVFIDITDTATTGIVRGVMSDIASSGADNVTGVASYITKSAGGNATGLLSSVQATLSSGAISEFKAIEALVFDTGSSGGTITSQFAGYFVSQAANGSSVTTNNYGILVGPDSGGANNYGISITGPSSGANNYAIKSDATAQSLFAGSVKSSGATAGIGYATGAGGTVTQQTSKTTGVTLNNICGTVVTHNAALGSGASAVWLVTNSAVGANDVVILNFQDTGASTANAYRVEVAQIVSGGFNIRLTNTTGGSLSEAVTINFAVIKAVAA